MHSLAIEEQLAVLWYIYRDFVKENITPEAERPDENLSKSDGLVETSSRNVCRRPTSGAARSSYR